MVQQSEGMDGWLCSVSLRGRWDLVLPFLLLIQLPLQETWGQAGTHLQTWAGLDPDQNSANFDFFK